MLAMVEWAGGPSRLIAEMREDDDDDNDPDPPHTGQYL